MSKKYVDQSSENVGHALVTGATGLIGRALVPELLARGHRVTAIVRDAGARRDALEAMFGRREGLRFVSGDLDSVGLGLDAAARASIEDVGQVFHLGANFAWGLTPEEALRTNVEGTQKVVALAASLSTKPRLVLIGGYRLARRRERSGREFVPEARDFAHAGAYEASKYRAHVASIAAATAAGVPYTVVHPSSVIGDSRTGMTTQVTGLGESIVALARGELPVRAFGKHAFVPVVTVDFVAAFLASVAMRADTIGREYTLLDPETPRLDVLVDRAAAVIGVPAPKLRVPTWFVRMLPERITKTSREALVFLDDATYPVDDTLALIASMGLERPDIGTAVDHWVRYLARTHAKPSTIVRGRTASADVP